MSKYTDWGAMKFYARPRGWAFHADLNCMMLTRGQFDEMKYRRIYRSEAVRRKLMPCTCAVKALGSERAYSREIHKNEGVSK